MAATPQQPEWERLADQVGAAATEAAELVVGLGILGINRVQALRRQVEQRLAASSPVGSGGRSGGSASAPVDDLA
jgi:hypothetical protein